MVFTNLTSSFWAGARQGLITSGLNHAAHGVYPPRKGKYNAEFHSDGDGNFWWNTEKDSWEHYKDVNGDGYKTYQGQYEISLVEQGWDYLADNVLSEPIQGAKIIGSIFKGAFYDAPKMVIETGRAEHLRLQRSYDKVLFSNMFFYPFLD